MGTVTDYINESADILLYSAEWDFLLFAVKEKTVNPASIYT